MKLCEEIMNGVVSGLLIVALLATLIVISGCAATYDPTPVPQQRAMLPKCPAVAHVRGAGWKCRDLMGAAVIRSPVIL